MATERRSASNFDPILLHPEHLEARPIQHLPQLHIADEVLMIEAGPVALDLRAADKPVKGARARKLSRSSRLQILGVERINTRPASGPG